MIRQPRYKEQQETLRRLAELPEGEDDLDLVWNEEVWALEDGVYFPKGQLELPFAAHRLFDSEVPDYKRDVNLWTSFHVTFLEGVGLVNGDPDYRHFIDYQEAKLEDSLLMTDGFRGESVVREHVQGYFQMRKNVLDGALELSQSERNGLLGCFKEYE